MANSVRILHLASFSGNIGDNANHMGFRPWFEKQIGNFVSWTNLEIREFYWREREWDEALIEYINSYDLLIIGGGNYFELWVEDSPTGTSIAIEPVLFEKIKVPVFFNALGVDPGQGVSAQSRKRFSSFLEMLAKSDQYLVSVRNDGAMENLKKHIGVEYSHCVNALPDHGFFTQSDGGKDFKAEGSKRIAINLACDMSETRFAGFSCQAEFVEEMASVVSELAKRDLSTEFVFAPHIFRDLDIIFQTIECLDDRLRRTRVQVAPYGTGDRHAQQILNLYQTADVVMGMRFHSNVCPMAMGSSVLGLSCYPQIENLYDELGLREHVADVTHSGFGENIFEFADAVLSDPAPFLKKIQKAVSRVEKQREAFEAPLKIWLAHKLN